MTAILKKTQPMIFSWPKLGQFLSFFKNLKTEEQFINYIFRNAYLYLKNI